MSKRIKYSKLRLPSSRNTEKSEILKFCEGDSTASSQSSTAVNLPYTINNEEIVTLANTLINKYETNVEIQNNSDSIKPMECDPVICSELSSPTFPSSTQPENAIKRSLNNCGLDDFEIPKMPIKSVVPPVQSKKRARSKRPTKQPNIKKAFKKVEDQIILDLIRQQSLAEDVDPDEMQMALALSLSEVPKCDRENNEPCTIREALAGDDAKDEDGVARKLKQFGYVPKKQHREGDILRQVKGKREKWETKFTALTLRDDKVQKEKIAKRVEEFLKREDILSSKENRIFEPYVIELKSSYLKEIQAKRSMIGIHKEPSCDMKDYYVGNLVSPSKVKAGYLLRDFHDIPGRPITPPLHADNETEIHSKNDKLECETADEIKCSVDVMISSPVETIASTDTIITISQTSSEACSKQSIDCVSLQPIMHGKEFIRELSPDLFAAYEGENECDKTNSTENKHSGSAEILSLGHDNSKSSMAVMVDENNPYSQILTESSDCTSQKEDTYRLAKCTRNVGKKSIRKSLSENDRSEKEVIHLSSDNATLSGETNDSTIYSIMKELSKQKENMKKTPFMELIDEVLETNEIACKEKDRVKRNLFNDSSGNYCSYNNLLLNGGRGINYDYSSCFDAHNNLPPEKSDIIMYERCSSDEVKNSMNEDEIIDLTGEDNKEVNSTKNQYDTITSSVENNSSKKNLSKNLSQVLSTCSSNDCIILSDDEVNYSILATKNETKNSLKNAYSPKLNIDYIDREFHEKSFSFLDILNQNSCMSSSQKNCTQSQKQFENECEVNDESFFGSEERNLEKHFDINSFEKIILSKTGIFNQSSYPNISQYKNFTMNNSTPKTLDKMSDIRRTTSESFLTPLNISQPKTFKRYSSAKKFIDILEEDVNFSDLDEIDKLVYGSQNNCQKSLEKPHGIDRLISGKIEYAPERSGENEFEEVLYDGKKYKVKSKDVEEMPDYKSMDSTALLRELYKFGLKPFKRKQAIILLEYIYNQTHPIVLDDKNTSESHSKDNIIETEKLHKVVNKSDNKLFLKDCDGKILLKEDNLVAELPNENYIFPTSSRKKVSSCLVPLHLAWFNLIKSNRSLYESLLHYEPIDLQEIYLFLKSIGLRYEPKEMKKFFDNRCIIFRYDLSDGKNNRHVRKPKSRKKTAH